MTDLTAARLLCEKMTAGEYRAINAYDMDSDLHPELVHVWAYTPEVLRPGQSSMWPGGMAGTEVANCEESADPEANAAGIVLAVSLLRALCDEGAVGRLGKVLEPYLYAEGLGKKAANLIITSIFDAAGREG